MADSGKTTIVYPAMAQPQATPSTMPDTTPPSYSEYKNEMA